MDNWSTLWLCQQFAIENMALIEIVDLPNLKTLKMVIIQFAKCKRLPEGTCA